MEKFKIIFFHRFCSNIKFGCVPNDTQSLNNITVIEFAYYAYYTILSTSHERSSYHLLIQCSILNIYIYIYSKIRVKCQYSNDFKN